MDDLTPRQERDPALIRDHLSAAAFRLTRARFAASWAFASPNAAEEH